MAVSKRSKRFDTNLITEKIVPIVLVVLLLVLLAVFVVIALSLVGAVPTVK